MILGMQDFDFCPNLVKFYPNFTEFIQILPNLSKFTQILPKFTQILPKLAYSIFCPNLPEKFAKEYGRTSCSPSSYATDYMKVWFLQIKVSIKWKIFKTILLQ